MSFDFFGRTFYFLANDMQREKAWRMLGEYIFKPQMLLLIFVMSIYLLLLFVSFYTKKVKLQTALKKLSPLVYLFLILTVTILNRDAGTREIRLSHDPWFTSQGFHESNMLGFLFNTVLYVPFGCLLYNFMNNKKYPIFAMGIILIVSLSVELLQYLLSKGVTAVDDLAANLIGGIVGICCVWIINHIKR